MTVVKHTPGPWHVKGSIHEMNFDICTDANYSVASIHCTGTLQGDASDQANAHRIVAAVNACEGISTEALEGGVIQEMLKALEKSRDSIQQLAGMVQTYWKLLGNDCTKVRAGDFTEAAELVIAKAQGQA